MIIFSYFFSSHSSIVTVSEENTAHCLLLKNCLTKNFFSCLLFEASTLSLLFVPKSATNHIYSLGKVY